MKFFVNSVVVFLMACLLTTTILFVIEYKLKPSNQTYWYQEALKGNAVRPWTGIDDGEATNKVWTVVTNFPMNFGGMYQLIITDGEDQLMAYSSENIRSKEQVRLYWFRATFGNGGFETGASFAEKVRK